MHVDQLVDQRTAAAAQAAGAALARHRVRGRGASLDRAAHLALEDALAVADEHGPDLIGSENENQCRFQCLAGSPRGAYAGAVQSRFDRDTEARPLGNGAFEVRIDRGWWVVRGPNGGYIAALLVRALEHAVGDAARVLRSLTVHYVRVPGEGEARVETAIERAGRSVTTASARLLQGGQLQALALAAFALPRPSAELHHALRPEVAPP